MTSHPMTEDQIKALDRNLRILIETDGTLTRMLRIVYDDEITVKIVNQKIRFPASIRVSEFDESIGRILDRQVLLCGRNSGIPLIAAESMIALDLLPTSITKVLTETNHPIGETVAASRLETYKEPVEVCIVELPDWAKLRGQQRRRPRVVARRYCITSGGHPVITVTEYFLRHQLEATNIE